MGQTELSLAYKIWHLLVPVKIIFSPNINNPLVNDYNIKIAMEENPQIIKKFKSKLKLKDEDEPLHIRLIEKGIIDA